MNQNVSLKTQYVYFPFGSQLFENSQFWVTMAPSKSCPYPLACPWPYPDLFQSTVKGSPTWRYDNYIYRWCGGLNQHEALVLAHNFVYLVGSFISDQRVVSSFLLRQHKRCPKNAHIFLRGEGPSRWFEFEIELHACRPTEVHSCRALFYFCCLLV